MTCKWVYSTRGHTFENASSFNVLYMTEQYTNQAQTAKGTFWSIMELRVNVHFDSSDKQCFCQP